MTSQHETAQEYVETEPFSDVKKFVAEGIGTFVLVFSAVGTAVFAGAKVGNLGVALAFGLTLALLVYAIGPVSGCHVNPAVTFGQFLIGRIEAVKALMYVGAQVLGGLVAGVVLFAVAKSLPSYDRATNGLGANGWGDHSPSAIHGPLGGVLQSGYGIGAMIVIGPLVGMLMNALRKKSAAAAGSDAARSPNGTCVPINRPPPASALTLMNWRRSIADDVVIASLLPPACVPRRFPRRV